MQESYQGCPQGIGNGGCVVEVVIEVIENGHDLSGCIPVLDTFWYRQEIHRWWISVIGKVKDHYVLFARFWNAHPQDVGDELTMRINQTTAAPGSDVLVDQAMQKVGFSDASFADHTQMTIAVRQGQIDWMLIACIIVDAQANAILFTHHPRWQANMRI